MRGHALLTLTLTVSLLRAVAANTRPAGQVPPAGGASNTAAELANEAKFASEPR
jgi:hypothetical protein